MIKGMMWFKVVFNLKRVFDIQLVRDVKKCKTENAVKGDQLAHNCLNFMRIIKEKEGIRFVDW